MIVYNGLGPWWFPAFLRRFLTVCFRRFFREASIERHDAAYGRGRPARWICDRGFRRAMQRDAARAASSGAAFLMDLAAWVLWMGLRAFGWLSYNRARK